MSKPASSSVIRLRGVRQNNLKHFDLDLPCGQLIVVTGLSGSGKSSLAFDTLYAEGQRRYVETFSPYARQFFDRMDRPQVDSIQGIPPAIAIEQRNAVKSTRSTVGTMTEICDYMKVVWAHLAQLHCRQCSRIVQKETPQQIWHRLKQELSAVLDANSDLIVTFDLPLSEKLSVAECLNLVRRQGYQRILDVSKPVPTLVRIDDAQTHLEENPPANLTVVQDRIRFSDSNRGRMIEALEQAYHFGKGRLAVWQSDRAEPLRFSRHLHCAACNLEYRDPTPALFSFNHPLGACPSCRGFGRTISIDYNLALPDRSLALAQGVVKPWQSGQGIESQQDLMKFCKRRGVPTDVPFNRLSREHQDWVIHGDPLYGTDPAHEWPRAWYGIQGYFRWLESKSYKMHVRVQLSKYRAYRLCPDCSGARFQPDTLLYRIAEPPHQGMALADFYRLPVRQALEFVSRLAKRRQSALHSDPVTIALGEVASRLQYLDEVGLGYLTLDRPTRTLSGGETERVNLTTCLGSRLVNTLFVLDEPTVGLHPRDSARLTAILERLRDTGNTVVVVEHEPIVMRAADQVIDLGPGQGAAGGHLVFQGSYRDILRAKHSLTGQFLSGRKRIEIPERRSCIQTDAGALREQPAGTTNRSGPCRWLRITGISRHNLRNVTAELPLNRLIAITGVSGSGKTTLVREALLPSLTASIRQAHRTLREIELSPSDVEPISGETEADVQEDAQPDLGECAVVPVEGAEHLGRVVLVDQASIGRTPRSNPAVYIGAFEAIRALFAESDLARQRGLTPGAFSFNSAQGQCESCRGAGFEKIEMQFLSDVYIRCNDCNGRRYRDHILEIRLASERAGSAEPQTWNIADLLDATVDEAIDFLAGFPVSKPAKLAQKRLAILQEIGLGYLKLGQPINTLSGGESQRLKLVRHLADSIEFPETKPILFLLDEPTTGLHFQDVAVLLRLLQRLVDAGHSVVVIEHHLDVIKSADWIIDLGPEAGELGGRIVVQGSPESVAACPESHTGRALRELLPEIP